MSSQINSEEELYQALVSVDRLRATRILNELNTAWTPLQRIERLAAPVLKRIGDDWERGVISLAQVYMSARICEDILLADLPSQASVRKGGPKMAIVTLYDHHFLGKKIVYAILRSSGFELIDYGQGVTVEKLVPLVKSDGIKILLISTLMLRSAQKIKDLRDQLDKAGLDTRIVVGGAPFIFDKDLWKEVGADAMATTASESISLIERLAKEAR